MPAEQPPSSQKADAPGDRSIARMPAPPRPDADVVILLGDEITHGGGPVRICETHAALVFVGPHHAYKVKRPVRYDYLDFSTLELREKACRREIEINQPAAPEIYHAVVAVTRDADGRLALDGKGEVIEWAVHMRAFDENDVLVHRVAKAPLGHGLVKALAQRVHAQHAGAHITVRDDAAAAFAAFAEKTCRGLAQYTPPLAAHEVARYRARSTARLRDLAPLVDRRGRDGFVRRCHGDLHLANIVMIDGAPVLFDALEFDEALATVDTLYDLAFLLMDLVHRRARATANLLLSHYLWLSGTDADLDGLAALPLFMAERAAVRALVTAQRASAATRAHGADVTNDADVKRAAAYLARALDLLDDATPPLLVAVGGLSGTGKSTLAAHLAPRLGRTPGAVHIRSDLERKALAGVGETDRLPPASYTLQSAAEVYDRLAQRATRALSAGQAVVVDAVFSRPEERAAIEHVARAQGREFVGLWLEAPLATLARRVDTRRGDASDATAEVVATQAGRGVGEVAWPRIDAGGTPETTLSQASTALKIHTSID